MSIADNKETTYSTTPDHGFFHAILHDLRSSLRGETHSLDDIRQEMTNAMQSRTKLFDVLKQHHDYIRESLVVCLDRDAKDNDRQQHLTRLLKLFEMHAKAEEQALYKLLISSSEKYPRVDGSVAQDEHELVYKLADDLHDMHFESLWTEDVDAKCLVLCELIVNHLKKEEEEIFPLAKDCIDSIQLNNKTSEYINLCENFLAMNEIRAKGIFL